MFGYRTHRWGDSPIWESIPDPVPGPGEVLIEVEACGIGRTVLNNLKGNLSDPRSTLPRVPGHELVGRDGSSPPNKHSRYMPRSAAGP
jgi:D-arabinose 1-dehydrogenase-like Zn-dependent alcohol dehydrogenase